MRLAWLTDIHLNFVTTDKTLRFLESVPAEADAVVITGDIAESPTVAACLRQIDDVMARPVYFVLGNHDFYRGSIADTRRAVSQVASEAEHLIYLTQSEVVELTPSTALVGHDGWADGRFGDFHNSRVSLTDFRLIAELVGAQSGDAPGRAGLRKTLERLADEAAEHFERVLTEAVKNYSHVIAATHVPPFREAAWHEGRICDEDWLPHFSSKVVGDVLLRVMQNHPKCKLSVLCGHTHGGGEVKICDNLRVHTGEAEEGQPVVQQVLEIP